MAIEFSENQSLHLYQKNICDVVSTISCFLTNKLTNYKECSRDYTEAVKLIGRDLHPNEHFRCTSNGDYDILQCFQGKCLCVDPKDGSPLYPNDELVNITEISKEKLRCCKIKRK